MLDQITWQPTAQHDFGAWPVGDHDSSGSAAAVRQQAVRLLLDRGFSYAGEDALGLPCYRSRSGAMLIGVGSCRCLAYANVQGRLQVVAAARTLSLLCRIAPDPSVGSARASPGVDFTGHLPAETMDDCPAPELVLVI